MDGLKLKKFSLGPFENIEMIFLPFWHIALCLLNLLGMQFTS